MNTTIPNDIKKILKKAGVDGNNIFNIELSASGIPRRIIKESLDSWVIEFGDLDFEFDPPEIHPLSGTPDLIREYDTPLKDVPKGFSDYIDIANAELLRFRTRNVGTPVSLVNYHSYTHIPYNLSSEKEDIVLMADLMKKHIDHFIWGGDFFRGFNPVEGICLFKKLLILEKSLSKETLENDILGFLYNRINEPDVREYTKRMSAKV